MVLAGADHEIVGCLLALSVAMLMAFSTVGCSSPVVPEIMRTRLLPPGPGNPRNSEGAFVTLKDGRILLVYTHFTGSNDDNAAAHLASRVSCDGGKTWSDKDEVVLPDEVAEGGNCMSASLLRLRDGRIALFYLKKKALPPDSSAGPSTAVR